MQSIGRPDRYTKDATTGLYVPLKVRDRRPPRFAAAAGLAGRITWELRRAGRVINAGHQHNLITDAGLDNWGTAEVNAYEVGAKWRAVCALGEGSAAPDVSDTVLGSEVVSVSGSSVGSGTGAISGGAATITLQMQYVFNFSGNYNLTEFGFRPVGAGADLSIRELFRDESDNPATITVLVNDQLTITHEQIVTVSPVGANIPAVLDVAEFDRDGNPTGNQQLTGWHSVATGLNTGNSGRWLGLVGLLAGEIKSAQVRYANSPRAACEIFAPSSVSAGGSGELVDYVAGAHKRVKTWTVPASSGNADWYALHAGHRGAFNTYGAMFEFVFDQSGGAQTFTKENTHKFAVTVEASWGRA